MDVQPNHPKPNSPDNVPASPPTPIIYESEEFHWEYKSVKLNLDEEALLDETHLNEWGTKGWELAAVVTHNKTAHYYFKRPVEES